MFDAALDKSLKKHMTKQNLYGQLPTISQDE